MTVATTELITIGVNWVTAKSPTMISAAKIAPAMGALKVAEMPAAAPQPTSVRTPAACRGLNHWPSGRAEGGADLDDRALAADRASGADGERGGERLDADDAGSDHCRRGSATAFMTSGMPWPLASRAKK